jgi:DHA2 family multidrug resistance protein
MLTLVRNVASSIGISIVIARLTSGTTATHAILSEHITPFNNALQMPNVTSMINMNTDAGRAAMDAILNIQSAIIAFGLDYQMVMLVTLCAIPLALMIGSSKAAMRVQAQSPDHAVVID